MTRVEAKVTSKGQITLPVEVRTRLNVGPGDKVVFVEGSDGRIVVRSRAGTLADMRGMVRDKVKIPKGGDIDRWIDEARSRALPDRPKRRKGAGR
jgi:AbrB family looped-hinge helix DNA binding protein